jgi:integrase
MPRRREHPYLTLRGGVWYVRKTIKVGAKTSTIKRSTGYSRDQKDIAEAVGQQVLREETEKLLYGFSTHTWGEAAAMLLKLEGYKTHHVYHCQLLQPFLENVPLIEMHTNHPELVRFKNDRLAERCKNNTINRSLEVVSVVLNFATTLMDGPTPWLKVAPRIKKLPRRDKQRPEGSEHGGYPLTQGEYGTLFTHLKASQSSAIHDMALFGLHTALRESWICKLKWEWERRLPQLGQDVFLFELPDSKNGLPMYAFCNSVAREVVNRQRGNHPEYVFTYAGHRISKMNITAWKTARRKAGLENVFGQCESKMPRHFRVHDLRVTCSTWLREAGVSKEDRQAILNHYNGDITTHYSVTEIGYMLEQVEKLVNLVHKPRFYLVRATA